jgi:TP901-1 family phage major tail protein
MGVQNGKDLLIKMDMTGTGLFQTVAGLRASRISFNAQTVDVTSLESQGGWRELLAGAGVKSAQVSGSGVFRDAATDARARAVFFDGEIPQFQIIIPDFGTIEGPFQITSLDYAGSYNGEATFELALASAGVLGFVAHLEPGLPPVDYPGDPDGGQAGNEGDLDPDPDDGGLGDPGVEDPQDDPEGDD